MFSIILSRSLVSVTGNGICVSGTCKCLRGFSAPTCSNNTNTVDANNPGQSAPNNSSAAGNKTVPEIISRQYSRITHLLGCLVGGIGLLILLIGIVLFFLQRLIRYFGRPRTTIHSCLCGTWNSVGLEHESTYNSSCFMTSITNANLLNSPVLRI